MDLAGLAAGEWLLLIQHELLLFAGLFFLVGAIDEVAVDAVWLWLRLRGKARAQHLADMSCDEALQGRAAVFIPAWQEDAVIGTTITHMLEAWPQAHMRLFVGCYRNDASTVSAAIEAMGQDSRVRVVVHERSGPSTKADCLNRLYLAMAQEEARSGKPFRLVLLHDAEDMVDPLALGLLDQAICEADFVQLPVLPVAHPQSRWIASHYCEEFAEAHGKAMVVREALGAALPSAGVGCAVARDELSKLASGRSDNLPFAPDSLTEDYVLGLSIARQGGRMKLLRVRKPDGQLVATHACFPSTIKSAVQQKTRWLHGIAFEGWDRLGWSRKPAEFWMRWRDRRGPMTAIVLAVAYLLLLLSTAILVASAFGLGPAIKLSPMLWWLLALNLASLLWRAGMRCLFTAREYGWREGLRAIARIPVGNIIAIMAGRRAVGDYFRSLAGKPVVWGKTDHAHHAVVFRTGAA